MSDNRDIAYAIFGFCCGVWAFFHGFKRLRKKRIIENIPTSKVRSLAMGLVELVGKAKKNSNLKGVFTQTECVYYRYTIERYRRGSRSGGHWVTVAKGDSGDCRFFLEDETGRVSILAKGADCIMPPDFQHITRLGSGLPANIEIFLNNNNIKYKGFFGYHRMRFKEWYICPGEEIYVLGAAMKSNDSLESHRKKLMGRIAELKSDSNKMAEVDLNKDGQISQDEWDRAVTKIEKELLEEELKGAQKDELSDVVIAKGQTEKIFIISDRTQKELTKKLTFQAFSGIFGGAALALAMLWYLLYRFNIFK